MRNPITINVSRIATAIAMTLWWLGGSAMAQGIYTCVDGTGRKITADRPIAECTDRAQQEISPSGTVRRVLGPSLTAKERLALENEQKREAEVRSRQDDEKRRDRALRVRYPNREVHDNERNLALAQVDESIRAATKRMQTLMEQRNKITAELEFYANDLSKASPLLKPRLDENTANLAAQKRFIADQGTEKQRVNSRFDQELTRLNKLWYASGVENNLGEKSADKPKK